MGQPQGEGRPFDPDSLRRPSLALVRELLVAGPRLDDRGRVSEWSEPAVWHMGLLDESDWQCQWIGAPWQGDEPLADTGGDVPPRAPLLRKAFRADKPVASARFYGTGLGYFELYMNGEKVGDDVLVPNQTNYGKRTNLDRERFRWRTISGNIGSCTSATT